MMLEASALELTTQFKFMAWPAYLLIRIGLVASHGVARGFLPVPNGR
jgi:hypothetical protein